MELHWVLLSQCLYTTKVLKKPILWIFDRIIIPVAIGGVLFGLVIFKFRNSRALYRKRFRCGFAKLGETEPRHPAQLYEAFGYILVLQYYGISIGKQRKENNWDIFLDCF